MPRFRNPSPKMPRDSGDSCGLSPVETPRVPRRPPEDNRTQSLDRQVPRKDSESLNSRYPSGPTYRKVLRRTASDGARGSRRPSHFAETQGAGTAALPQGETQGAGTAALPQGETQGAGTAALPQGETQGVGTSALPQGETQGAETAALPQGETQGAETAALPQGETQGAGTAALPQGEASEFLLCEQEPPEDTKKERPPKQAQRGWISMFLSIFLLRIGLEEPTEKTSKKSKRKGGPSKLPEAAEEPGIRKKSQEKKASRKKHSHKKPAAEETTGPQNSGAEGQEDLMLSLTASPTEEVDLGLIRKGRPDSETPQALLTEGGHAAQAAGSSSEDDAQKPDQDEIIWKIVELLKKAGDHLDEEQVQPYTFVTSQKSALPPKKKSQERKSGLKKSLSLKRLASEEPKRVGAAAALGPETRPKRPNFLPLCISSRRPSTSSNHDPEEPGFHEVPTVDAGYSHSSELHTPAECQGPAEKLPRDRAGESREFRRKILALLQNAEELKEEQQAQVQEAEEAGENAAPVCKVKPQGKKSNLRRAFSLRKRGSKDSKRTEAASPEARPSRKNSFLPMCVSGHRASVSSGPEDVESQKTEAAGEQAATSPEVPFQARSHAPDGQPLPEGAQESKESIIHKLVEGLQEVDSELGRQIRQYPSFKKFFNEFSDASLRKLVATLDRQKARLSEEDGSLVNRPPPCAFGSLNKFAANHSCAICTLMQSRGQYQGHSYAHFLSRKAQQNITSLDGQSPD